VQTGPILVTHTGISGPAALKTSAYGARVLAECGYKGEIEIDWIPDIGGEVSIYSMGVDGEKLSFLCSRRCKTTNLASLFVHFLETGGLRSLGRLQGSER